jgi:signal transduction histidine kinase
MIFLKNNNRSYDSISSSKTKRIGIIFIILIVIISYGLFFYLQSSTETNIKTNLFDEQKQRQTDSTRAVSQHASSDLNLVLTSLKSLANYGYIQQGELTNDKARSLLQETYLQINSILDRLFIVDKNGIVMVNMVPKGETTFVGSNVSKFDWITQTKIEKKPIFSNGYMGLDGKYRIAITYPIINRDTGQYMGLVGAVIPTIQFFSHYGNIYDIDSRFLVAYDSNDNYIATPRHQLLGKNYFGNEVQQFFHYNDIQNNLYRKVFSGQPSYAVYDFGSGERLNTGYPIFLQNKPVYFVFVVTPTSTIYSHVNDILFTQRIETFSLLAGITAAIAVLIVFLIKWNSGMYYEVKRRTKELHEANEQLKVHDKMQQEFINIAAHELRTPTQVIVGYCGLVGSHPEKREEILQAISRNAERLQRLTNDILDVARIESKALNLNKEQFKLNELISNVVKDYKSQIEKQVEKIKLVYNNEEDRREKNDLVVKADRGRIAQVISNLISNAIKFTKERGDEESTGTITITTIEKKDTKEVVINVKDTGTGIDPEILSRLFTKFATKSQSGGTGLGLFISKSIIESHGGRIWAENNKDGNIGSTFSFSLPMNI